MWDDPIAQAEEELRRAMLAGDLATLDRLIDGELVFTTEGGAATDRVADLELYRTGRLRLTKMTPSEQRVRRYGTSAVVSVKMDVAGTFDGKPFGGAFRYTRLWNQRAEGWRVVVGHVSPVLM